MKGVAMQRKNENLSPVELQQVHEIASQASLEKFIERFANGFIAKLGSPLKEESEHKNQSADLTPSMENIYYAAKNGDLERFKYLFERSQFSCNQFFYHPKKKQARTLLHAVIAGDKADADPKMIPKRQAIACYLLAEGANMDLHAWHEMEKKPSPWQIVQHQKTQMNISVSTQTANAYYQQAMFYLQSFFYIKPKPSRGANIAQILVDYRHQSLRSQHNGK